MRSLLTKIKEIFVPNKSIPKNACFFCKRKMPDLRNYRNEANKRIKVCYQCVEYAERRAYRK
ncbi:hypothetical protein P9B03_02740 [Metasolibacillus meyeri]|uniref:Stc1 domain-containing protein n=1 Tax=Metasolibacillus meyeri TaxID=1071052 RepID=A0AAW9NIY3_9BACL|nr:hypothetical protein [Metasolibacillus meyeri]MEC1177390.1 hypothetical protein [Metasolibacillus meyeri]